MRKQTIAIIATLAFVALTFGVSLAFTEIFADQANSREGERQKAEKTEATRPAEIGDQDDNVQSAPDNFVVGENIVVNDTKTTAQSAHSAATTRTQPNIYGGSDYYDSNGQKSATSQPNIFGGQNYSDGQGKQIATTQPNIFGGQDIHNKE
ncbi:MAG: hypothetical protein WCP79_15635 [Bacillota bacterium]